MKNMKTLRVKMVGLLATALILFSAFRADKPVITIFMIGDSTMANKKIDGGNPERGWGMVLPGFFSEDIRIDNHAANGRSSKSFISEGRWEKVISKVKKGDYVFIQFGHNDEKADSTRHTDPGSTFDEILRRYVNETRAKGGIPVLFNSIVRRNFVQPKDDAIAKDVRRTPGEKEQPKEGTVLFDTHGAYLDAPRNVAKELGVTFIDMNKITHDLVQGLGPVESKKLFMFVEPNQVPAFPKGREDNTHLNVYGARTIVGLAVDAIGKEIPELAKYIRQFDYVVAQDGSGDFFTVQEAINAVPDFRKDVRTTILIRKGTYKEKLIIPESKINISLIGEDGAILTYDGFANKKNVFGENMGTSGSSSCYIYAPDFYAENITFENSSGPVGQAVACFVSADRVYFKNCRFLGFQDTLYTYSKQSRQYYEDCYIEGTVDFFTVQEAINAVPDFRKDVRTTILIRKGTYKEKLIIPESKINISLIGEDGAILTYDGFANKKNVFGENMGTSGSSSCYIYAPDFYAENITFENSSGPVGQAVACFVSADRVYFKNCRFLGFQDTLYTYSKQSRQYYEDCYIEGTVDFIFGWSTAVFNRCHIHSKRDGYVTAPSTDKGKKYGYVFYDCKLTAEPEATKVYLSRPWRPYAQAVFIRCELGKHILPVGWNNWGKKENENTVFYAEYESRGEGANPKARAAFSQQLKNLQGYEITTVLAGEDGWSPVADGNKLITVKR